MLGEGGGRAITSALGVLSKTMGSRFSESILKPSGELTDDAVTILRNSGIDPANFSKALAESAQKTGLKPIEALRQAAATQVGVKLTTGQRTGELPQLRTEEIARQSGNESIRRPLVERDISTNRALKAYSEDIISGTGGTPGLESTGAGIKSSLRTRELLEKNKATELYTKARESAGAGSPFPQEVRDDFFKKVIPILDDFEGRIPPAVHKKLTEFGIFGNAKRDLTFLEGEKFRKLLNDYTKVPGPEGEAVRRMKSAYDGSVSLMEPTPVGKFFAAGRAAVSARKQVFNSKDVIERVLARKSYLSDLVPDEQVVPFIQRSSIAETKKLVQALKLSPGGKQQIDNMNATVMRDLFDQAMPPNVKNEAGEVVFSGSRLNTVIKKLGDEKLQIILGPEGFRNLHALKIAADAVTNMPRGAVNTSSTATFLEEMRRATNNTPVLGYLVEKMRLGDRAIVKRALKEGSLSEETRIWVMSRSLSPKIGTAVGAASSGDQ